MGYRFAERAETMTGQQDLLSLCMQHFGSFVRAAWGVVARLSEGMRHCTALAAAWRRQRPAPAA